jgi:hypothetical protein
MDTKIIQYDHWEKASGMFEFPFRVCQTMLLQHCQDYPHDQSTQQFLETLTSRSAAEDRMLIKLRHPNPMSYVAAALVEQGIGSVYCQQCQQSYPTQALVLEHTRNISALTGGEGRRFYCPKTHVVLDVTDVRA